MKNRIGNRFLSLFLALVMVIGMVSTTAFAAPGDMTLAVNSDVKVLDTIGGKVDPDDYITIEPVSGDDMPVWFMAGISVDEPQPYGVFQIAMDELFYIVLEYVMDGTLLIAGIDLQGYDLSNLSKAQMETALDALTSACAELGMSLGSVTTHVDSLLTVLSKALNQMGGDPDDIRCSIVNGGYDLLGDGRKNALSEVGAGMYILAATDACNSANQVFGCLVVTPKAAEVKISSDEDDKGNVYLRTYDGQPQEGITVTVNGKTVTENLKFMYIGMDTTADGYCREQAPTDAGVYAVVAVYLDREGKMIKEFGGTAKVLVIQPGEASFNLNDTEVTYDGKQHFAAVTGNYHYITVARETVSGDVYVNVPGNMDKFETAASLIPSTEISTKVLSALEGFDGDVKVSTVQARLSDYIKLVEDVKLYDEVLAAAEKAYNRANKELRESAYGSYVEMVDDLIAKLEAEGYTLTDAAGLAAYAVMQSGVSLDMDDAYDILAALLSKADQLGYVQDAETLLKTLAVIGGVEDTPAVKAAIKDVVETLDSSVKAVSADVIAAAKTEDPAIIKAAVVEALQGIEVFFDKEVLPAAQTIVNEFDGDITIYFEQNPVNVGTYDCCAVNVSANYMPSMRIAQLVINPIEVTVTMDDVTLNQGEALPTEWGYTVEGLLSGDSLTVTGSTEVADTSVHGEYTISGVASGYADYYDVTVVPGTLTIVPDSKYVCWNMNTKVYYEKLETALAEANNATVQMLKDYECYFVNVATGNTLDLNGCDVTATYAIAFDGAHVIDGTEGEGGLVIGEKALVLDEQNEMLPVYDGTAYRFGSVKFALKVNAEYTGEGVRVDFLPAPSMTAVELLKDGAADNNVQVVVRLTWNSTYGERSQNVAFREDLIQTVYASNVGSQFAYGRMFFIVLKNIEAVEGLKVSVAMVSGTDTEIVSKTLAIN